MRFWSNHFFTIQIPARNAAQDPKVSHLRDQQPISAHYRFLSEPRWLHIAYFATLAKVLMFASDQATAAKSGVAPNQVPLQKSPTRPSQVSNRSASAGFASAHVG